jgi:hypothetical protein
MTGYAIQIDPTIEYRDRSFETASWWDKYLIDEGTYELEAVDSAGNPLPEDATLDFNYARVFIPATLIESYRESRLLQHSTADHKTNLAQRGRVYLRLYGYELAEKNLGRKWFDGAGTLIKVGEA